MIVRPLTAADADLFREIRLEALRLHPGAYGSTLADWQALSREAYVARILDGVIFGLFTQAGLGGIMAYDREAGGNARHRAGIHAVYVRQALRGSGAADQLLTTLIDKARADGVVQLKLSVNATNLRAAQFYRRHGFVQFGQTPRALRVGGVFQDECHLMRRLDD